MKSPLAVIVVVAGLLANSAALAQSDVVGSRDHPSFTGRPGFYVS